MSEDEDSACLLHLLNRLAVALETPSSLDVDRPTLPKRWKDKDYVYLEANVPDAAESEIDITFHGTTVFIRMVR